MVNNTPNSLPPNMPERPSDGNRELYPSQPDKTEYGSRGWKLPASTVVSSTVEPVFEESPTAEQLGFVFEDPIPVIETPVAVTPKDRINDDAIPMPEYVKNLVGPREDRQPNSSNPEGRSDAATRSQKDGDSAWLKAHSPKS